MLLSGDVGADAGFPACRNADTKPNCNALAYSHEHTSYRSNRYRDSTSYSDTGAISFGNCYPNADANGNRDAN